MSNAVARVQRMLESAGFAKSTIALAAAKDGDFEIMEMLLEEFGPSVFHGGRDSDPYVYAAAGNRPDVMQWFEEKSVLPELDRHVSWRDGMSDGRNARVSCYPAFVAAQNGALEALEYIADKIPAIREYPLQRYPMTAMLREGHPWAERDGKVYLLNSSGAYNEANITYAGLLTTCAIVVRGRGDDASPVVDRLRKHLEGNPPLRWGDVSMALRFDQEDTARLLMRAGAKIELTTFMQQLSHYSDPIRALRCVREHVEESSKGFSSMCEPYETGGSYNTPAVVLRTVDDMIANEGNGFGHHVQVAVSAVHGLTNAGFRDHPKVDDAAGLSVEMARFMRSLDSRFAGPAMLTYAVSSYVPELVKTLLESGVNPNEYAPCKPDKPGVTHVGKRMERRLAVHEAGQELMRLLVSYGADVNLPLWGTDQNLLYELCTKTDIDTQMLYVFAECGGDFTKKFDGKTAASLAKKKGAEFHGHFMAAKAHIAVLDGVGGQKGGEPEKKSRSAGMSPL